MYQITEVLKENYKNTILQVAVIYGGEVMTKQSTLMTN